MRVIPADGWFSAFIPLRSETHTIPRHTYTRCTHTELGDGTHRRSPDSRPRGARNWARNRTTPNESDEQGPGSNRASVLGAAEVGRRRCRRHDIVDPSSSGTRPRPCHKLPNPPPPGSLGLSKCYGALVFFALSTFLLFFFFFLLHVDSRLTAIWQVLHFRSDARMINLLNLYLSCVKYRI